jgi:hypothetical protein
LLLLLCLLQRDIRAFRLLLMCSTCRFRALSARFSRSRDRR